MIGLAKKVLLANTIGSIYENIAAMDGMSVVTAWLGCLAYTFQIYFDFSGYSDMAVGLGKMFGFEFMQNFNYPYISKSVTEFWRRWHISLGSWFREYVYIPLGGNRVTVPRHFTESSDRMVPDRSLAWGKLELCSMGALLRSDPHY